VSTVRTALLVEDDPTFRELIHYYLSDLGLEVVAVAEGRAALTWLATKTPDLVCLDLMLPETSGYEVCEQLKASPKHKTTPVLMMSARGLPMDRAHAEEVGADAYLVKPFTRAEFMSTAQGLLAKYTATDPMVTKLRE